jgi:hypothetical protein
MASAPELEVLEDSVRIADSLAVDHEHRHPPLVGEGLYLGSAGAALRDHHRVEPDALTRKRARYLAARTQSIGGGAAAIERGHRRAAG